MTLIAEAPAIAVIGGSYGQPEALLDAFEPEMMATARHMAETRAVSYRGLYVGGCAAVALFELGDIVFLEGANHSPYPGAPKKCAEMSMLWQTDALIDSLELDLNLVEVLGMYVAGPSDPDVIEEVNGCRAPTLHSCFDCREMLRNHRATRDHMRIVTFGAENDGTAPERFTLGTLLKQYENVEPPKTSRQLLEEGRVPLGYSALHEPLQAV